MRRWLFVLGPAMTLVLLTACGAKVNPFQKIAALGHKAPAAPADLSEMTATGQPLAANGWTNQPTVRLQAVFSSPESGAQLVPEVEFVPLGQAFSSTPNV